MRAIQVLKALRAKVPIIYEPVLTLQFDPSVPTTYAYFMYVCMYVCLSVRPSVRPSVSLSVCMSVCMCTYIYIYIYTCLHPVCLCSYSHLSIDILVLENIRIFGSNVTMIVGYINHMFDRSNLIVLPLFYNYHCV